LFDGNSHNVAFVSTGSAYHIYLDGIDKTLTVGYGSNDGSWGSISPDTIYFPYANCDSTLDELRIWEDERTQAEVQTYMYSELDGDEAGLVGYWKLDEGEGVTAEDSTSNENDGMISSDDLWVYQSWDWGEHCISPTGHNDPDSVWN